MVYAVVSKTTSRKTVWVRLPPCPLNNFVDQPIYFPKLF